MKYVYIVYNKDGKIDMVCDNQKLASHRVRTLAEFDCNITVTNTPLDYCGIIRYGWTNVAWWEEKPVYNND